MCIIALACALQIFGLWLTAHDNKGMIEAFAVLSELFSGATISLTRVCIAQVCNIGDFGQTEWHDLKFASLGTPIGVPLALVVLESNSNNYSGLIKFGGGFYSAAFVAFCMARAIADVWK